MSNTTTTAAATAVAAAAESNKPRGTLQTWREKLVTREDAYHLHKVFGILSLLSAAVRLGLVLCYGNEESDLGFRSHPEWTWPTLAAHLALGASSFQFRIPVLRIRDGGRICKSTIDLSESLSMLHRLP